MTKRILGFLLSVVVLMGMLSVTAFAADNEPTTIDLSKGSYTITEPGAYTVNPGGSIVTSNTLTVNTTGDVKIILNGATISAPADTSAISIESGNVTIVSTGLTNSLWGGDNGAGIYVAADASVTITGDAQLNAAGNKGTDDASGAAGIGGAYGKGDSGKITIAMTGDTWVVAEGYGVWASGIGSAGGYADNITITSGTVIAQGGYYSEGGALQTSYGSGDPEGGAGIGGGSKSGAGVGTITISNCVVEAYGGSKAAGIGAMFWNSVKAINIENAEVYAYGGSSSAGIGTSRAGSNGVSSTITISGENTVVEAEGGAYGAGIGAGYNGDSLGNGAVTSGLPVTTITISGGTITATGGEGGAGIGGGYKSDNIDIDITGGTVTAAAGALVSGKTIENGGSASAIGTGANGSGTFENCPAVEIADAATVNIGTNYEAAGGKPAVEGYVYKNGTLKKPWYDADATELHITCEDDLWDFAAAAIAGATFSGQTIYLDTDIDLGGETWTPAATFSGNFVGNNNTISNFHIDATASSGGFFKTIDASNGLEDVKVKDLILSNVTATVGAYRFGTLANSIKGVVHNVTVKNVKVTTTDATAWVGGMCAFMSWPWMTNCTVENLEVDATAGADFVAGFACILQKNSNHVFDNLDVKGFKVTVNDTTDGCGVAGFVGQTQRGWEYPKVINCDITGIDVTASGLVDVAGFIAWPGAHTTAENCTTEGKIDVTGVTSADCFAGGFFGNLGWNCDLGQMGHVVTNCSADVDIITKIAPAGGFVGSATNSNDSSMYATFNNCSASGNITCVESGTADIGGFAGDADRGVYNDCSASGTVTNNGTGYAGQFIGAYYDVVPKYDSRYPAGTRAYPVEEATLTNCTYTGISNWKFIGNIAEGAVVTIQKTVAVNASTDKKYTCLQDAVDEANNSDTITVIADIDGEAVTVGKSVTITGVKTLNDVVITASGTDVELTVTNLKFTGNSYINANNAKALTVSEVTADVNPEKITGRAAFIVLGTTEPTHGLKLTVTDNVISSAQSSGDGYSAAIFGWRYLDNDSIISGNTFGSEAKPYTFIAVKLMNAMNNAAIKFQNNTIYGTNQTYHFAGLDLYQNCSRDNVYLVLSQGNKYVIDESGSYTAYAVYLEGKDGTNVMFADLKSAPSTINGVTMTIADIDASGLPANYAQYYGAGVSGTVNGTQLMDITTGTFNCNMAGKIKNGYSAVENSDGTWTVVLAVAISADPADAKVIITDSLGHVIEANADGTYSLVAGDTYNYRASKEGYITKEDNFVAAEGQTVTITLYKEHVHSLSANWTSDAAGHWLTCSGCDGQFEYALHTESDWIVDAEATSSRNGSRHKECVDCHYVIVTEEISATGSSVDNDYWLYVLMMRYNQEFAITATATEGGSITPAGVSKVKYDKNITYTITPDEGYAIADVLVDGDSVGAVAEYTFKRVKKVHTITAVFVKTAWENPFTDVTGNDWFYEDVEFVTENGLMIGTSTDGTKFSPDAIVNRAMLVTVLWRMEGSPVVNSPVDFFDVPDNEWYTDAVNWASANGIVQGWNGLFKPEDAITREQVMAILNRYAVYKNWSENLNGNASDAFTNSEWSESNIRWAEANGILDGIGTDIRNLTEAANRAELAAYLRRFCENIMK